MASITPKTTREMCVLMLSEMQQVKLKMDSLEGQINRLSKQHTAEAIRCPFHPSRGENGGKILSRLEKIEQLISNGKAILFVATTLATLAGLGTLYQIIQKIIYH